MVTPVDVGGSIAKGLQINQLRQQIEAQKEARQSRNALRSLYAERFGGTDPKTGITWDTGRQQAVTNAGRPLYTDAAGGERYSEKSMTTQLPDGSWVNFPTVDRSGRILPEDEAFRMVQQAGFRDPLTGRQLETFGTMEDAVSAARSRSAGLTAQTRPMMNDQEFVGRAMAIDPQAGVSWQQFFDSRSAAELERDRAEAPLIVAAFENVRDQAGHDRARVWLHSQGVDVSDIPPQYSREVNNMVVQGARYLGDIKPQEGPKAPEGFRWTANGGLEPIPGYVEGKTALADATRAPQGPQTDAAKLEQDFRNGYLTAEQYEAAKLRAGQPDPKDSFANADKLRDEFVAQSKDFVAARDAYGRVLASAEEPSAAGDLALIFNYMKVLDPGSVVRESEFATAAQSGAFGDRIAAQVNRVLSGERLSDSMRDDFVARAGRLYRKQEELHDQLRDQYMTLSQRFEVAPENVVTEMRGQFPGAPGAAAPGAGSQPPAPGSTGYGATSQPAPARGTVNNPTAGPNPPAVAIRGAGVPPPPPEGRAASNMRRFRESQQGGQQDGGNFYGLNAGGAGGAASSYEGLEAENPATGEVVVWRNGQWVPKQ